MSLSTIPYVGKDAFLQGFLNEKFANLVVDACNMWQTQRVIMPTGYPAATFKVAPEGSVLDLSKSLPPLVTVFANVAGMRVPVKIPMQITVAPPTP